MGGLRPAPFLLAARGILSIVKQVALVEKNLPDCTGDVRDVGLIPRWEDPLDKEMATLSSILA